MSTINVDIVLPQSTQVVDVNGLKLHANSTTIQASNNNNAAVALNSTFVGVSTGFGATSGSTDNVAVGYRAGLNLSTGDSNTLIGCQAGQSLTTPSSNTLIGANAGVSITTGLNNTCLGESSGSTITTGNTNVFIGSGVGSGIPNITGQGIVLIGSGGGVNPSSPSASFEITLGNSFITALRCAQTSITSLSDARDKKEITELSAGLDFVNTLKPVEFVWDDRNEDGRHDVKDFGFIAQDLKKSQEDIELADTLKLVYEENPEKLEASYGKLIPILVKAIQDLSAKVEALENK